RAEFYLMRGSFIRTVAVAAHREFSGRQEKHFNSGRTYKMKGLAGFGGRAGRLCRVVRRGTGFVTRDGQERNSCDEQTSEANHLFLYLSSRPKPGRFFVAHAVGGEHAKIVVRWIVEIDNSIRFCGHRAKIATRSVDPPAFARGEGCRDLGRISAACRAAAQA